VRERTSATGSEREQREELERLQVELRDARAALQTVKADTDRAVEALSSAVDQARERRDAAGRRIEALKAEKKALKAEQERLEERLVEKRKEDAILARGAKLRDVYVDWNPNDRQHAVTDGYTASEVKWGAIMIGSLFALTLLFGTCR
jgi:chromosome segregation ATPase